MTLRLLACVAAISLGAVSGGAAWAAEPRPDAAWAFPPAGPRNTTPPSQTKMVSPPGVAMQLSEAQTRNVAHALDWRPKEHPLPPPAVTGTGRPGAMACGFCHLPDGRGRPENAPLAGLPADYIVAQVQALASGARVALGGPGGLMAKAAKQLTPQELKAAAAYFAKVKYVSMVKVVEVATIPKVDADHFIYHRAAGGGLERLGLRIIEIPDDMARFELRDGHLGFTAYVPPGAIRRGRALAARGVEDGNDTCSSCHGVGLRGMDMAPPLAGRSPTYLFRQLYGFQSGDRHDAGSADMKRVTAKLTTAEMIDLAAYAGSLRP
jgi:cytochrome c553